MKGGVSLGKEGVSIQERETTAEGVRMKGIVWITEGTSLVRCAETQEWKMSGSCRRGGRLPGRNTEEAGRKEEEEKEEHGQRNIRYEIAEKMVESIKLKAGRYENSKLTSQRTFGQNVKQDWDCSQVGNEEEEEEEVWQEENQKDL